MLNSPDVRGMALFNYYTSHMANSPDVRGMGLVNCYQDYTVLSPDFGGTTLVNFYPGYMVTSTDARGSTSRLLLPGYMFTSPDVRGITLVIYYTGYMVSSPDASTPASNLGYLAPPRTIFHGCQIVRWDPLDGKRRCPQKKLVWAMWNCMVSMPTHNEFKKGGLPIKLLISQLLLILDY